MSVDELREINLNQRFLNEFHRAGAEKWSAAVKRPLTVHEDVPAIFDKYMTG